MNFIDNLLFEIFTLGYSLYVAFNKRLSRVRFTGYWGCTVDSMSLFISRSDFLTGHGVRPVSDVNENFSTPVNIFTEQNGFREDSDQPASTQNTVMSTFFIKDHNFNHYFSFYLLRLVILLDKL